CTRRRIISQEPTELVSSRPFSARIFAAGWFLGTSKVAVTCPCSTPWRTSPASPRPPSASAKASSRMDLPAPVSPVSTARPRENSISSRSIRTMSRIDRRASMRDQPWCGDSITNLQFAPNGRCRLANFGFGILERFGMKWRPVRAEKTGQNKRLAETQLLERLGDIRTGILARLDPAGFYEIIGVLVPPAIGKIMPEHRCSRLRLADDTDRHIGFGQPRQRFFDMPRGLILRHHGLEAVDGGGVVMLLHVIAADRHLAAGELVTRAFELGLGADGVFRGRIFAHHLFKRGDRLLGSSLVAGKDRKSTRLNSSHRTISYAVF